MASAASAGPGAGPADRLDTFAVSLMLLLTLSWGFNQVAIKLANDGFQPLFQGGIRSLAGGILVWLWCRYRGIALFDRDGTLMAGLLAGALFAAEFALVYIGFDLTSASRGILFLNTMPFFTAIGAHYFLDERLTPVRFAGLVAAFGGVYLVFSDKLGLPAPGAIRGDLLCLVAGFLWAATTVVIKGSALRFVAAEKTLLYQLAISAVTLLPLSLAVGPLLRSPDVVSVGALAFQSAYVVAITYVLWFWLIRRYPATRLSAFSFLTPVLGVLAGGLFLGEALTPVVFTALAL
ncbi:MAG TPA: DMT family transporter, partial [Afifellaceae bacterium]|nr:DMT family transporter [Afifellaceae bacterium]